jgi:hypothetical protein
LRDAGKVLDNVRALRTLMSALDSAAYALSTLDEEGPPDLSARLTQDATDVMEVLKRLEASPAYQKIRKEYLERQSIDT